MGREKLEKSFSALEREYSVARRTIQSVFQHFTGRTVIQSEQDFEIAEKCAVALVSYEKKKRAVAYLESNQVLMEVFKELLAEEPKPILKEDQVDDDDDVEDIVTLTTADARFLMRMVQSLGQELRNLSKQLEDATGNPRLEAMKIRTNEEIKLKLYALSFKLHQDFGYDIDKLTVYTHVNANVKQYGPGPFYAAVQGIYQMDALSKAKGEGGISAKSNIGFFSLISAKIEPLWKSGAYANPNELAILLFMDENKASEIIQPTYKEEKKEVPTDVAYSNALAATLTNYKYPALNAMLFCKIIEDDEFGLLASGKYDVEAIKNKIDEIKSNPDLAWKRITCKEDTPFFIEDFLIKES